MTEHEQRSAAPEPTVVPDERGWLYHHIGRLSGTLLGLIAFIGLGFLAVAGSKSALGLLIVVVFGVFVISVGARLRGT